MALIKLTLSEMSNVKSQISSLAERTESNGIAVARIASNLDMEVKARQNIEEQLQKIKNDLNKQSQKLTAYSNVLNDVMNQFVSADSKKKNNIDAVSFGKFVTGTIVGMAGIMNAKNTPECVLNAWVIKEQLDKVNKNAGKNTTTKKTDVSNLKKFVNWSKNKAKKAAKSLKKTYGNVVQKGKDCISWVKKSYQDRGIVYTAIQYGKAAGKVVGGCAAIAAVIASGGALAPLVTVYGINDIMSGAIDIANIHNSVKNGGTAEIDEANLLKEGMGIVGGAAGGAVGKIVGNEDLGREVGEKMGSVLYTTGDVVSKVYTLETTFDKIHQAKDFNFGGIASESKNTMSGLWDLATKTDIKNLKYEYQLFKYQIPNTVNAVNNLSLIGDLASTLTGGYKDVMNSVAEQWLDGKNFNIKNMTLGSNDSYLGGLAGNIGDIKTTLFE